MRPNRLLVGSDRTRWARSGTTLMEVSVALVVLSLAMAALVQLAVLSARQRRVSETRRLAIQEVANQAEHVAALAWEATEPDKLTAWTPSAELSGSAPTAECVIRVTEDAGPPAGRRVHLEVTWADAAGHPVQPVGLTLWKFAPEGPP
jgi:Tfp pilus assembly protein PilV